MIQQPRFANHAAQQAMLGSAAVLDPEKYPRRAALAQARQKLVPKTRREGGQLSAQRAERERLAPLAAELADSMSLTDASRHLGINYKLLQRIAEDHFITFKPGKPGKRTIKEVVDDYLQEPADGQVSHPA